MPSGLIENNDGMGTGRNLASDRVEMQLHGLAVADRQHKCCAGAVLGTDRAEQVGRLRALIVRRARTRALLGPAIGELVLLTHPHLILEPHLYGCAGRELLTDFRHMSREVFLNASHGCWILLIGLRPRAQMG